MGVMGALAEPSYCPSAQSLIFKPIQKMESGHTRPCTASLAFPCPTHGPAVLMGAAKPGRAEGEEWLCWRHHPCALPTDLLQVLLPLVLALAALHGGPAPPPPADAQPEEPGLQLRGTGPGAGPGRVLGELPRGERSSARRSQTRLGTFFLRTDGEKTKILHSCLHLLVFLFLH